MAAFMDFAAQFMVCAAPDPPTCGCDSARQDDYRGDISVTETGLECQAWDAQSPHRHSRTPENYPDKGLEGGHNHCRNPDGEPRAWCYTTNPLVRWRYCDVPSCAAPTEPAGQPAPPPPNLPASEPLATTTVSDSPYVVSHEHCDADALPAESTSVSSLERDVFHKICPGSLTLASDGTDVPLGQPRCGDGSNFSFVYSRPTEEAEQSSQTSGAKVVVELAGGGACWDSATCLLQNEFLSFPRWMGALLGTSCSDYEDSILCSKTVGGTDFRGHHFVFVPYCTQDVHLGDVKEGTNYGVRHVGAHNLKRTLEWVFANFPNPAEVLLTGCSAGGTPLPVVYDIVNSHYSSENVRIDVVSDSPVYLTPDHFLRNYFPNWNAGTLVESTGFDFDSYKGEREFPTFLFDHVLGRSKEGDDFAFISHDADAVSLLYYRIMSDASQLGGDVTAKWWGEINESMDAILEKHGNVHTYFMEGTGHCSFSLNVPLENEGFDEWATGILQDDILQEVEADSHGSFALVSNTTTQSTAQSSASGTSNSGTSPFGSDNVMVPSPEVGAGPTTPSPSNAPMALDLSSIDLPSLPTIDTATETANVAIRQSSPGPTLTYDPPSLPKIDAAVEVTNVAGRQSSPALALAVMMVLSLRFLLLPKR